MIMKIKVPFITRAGLPQRGYLFVVYSHQYRAMPRRWLSHSREYVTSTHSRQSEILTKYPQKTPENYPFLALKKLRNASQAMLLEI